MNQPGFTMDEHETDNEEPKVSAARCYNCNEEGHVIKQCTRARREKGLCFTCGEASHKYRGCLRCREQQNSAVNIVQPLIVNPYIENNLPGIPSKC
ncbi:hypothetical protein Trydic_g13176 [Trypoxylus dichotomus]